MADPASERRIVEFRMPDAASASDDKEMTPEELMKFIQDLEAGNVAMPQVGETVRRADPRGWVRGRRRASAFRAPLCSSSRRSHARPRRA